MGQSAHSGGGARLMVLAPPAAAAAAGPNSEQCVFMGPGGHWFDFNCASYDPAVHANAKTGEPATPGPVRGARRAASSDSAAGALCCGGRLIMVQHTPHCDVESTLWW